jgi:hypothetical protein
MLRVESGEWRVEREVVLVYRSLPHYEEGRGRKDLTLRKGCERSCT